MDTIPESTIFYPSDRSDDPEEYATRMRLALNRDGPWSWYVLTVVDLPGLDGKVREIGQRFNVYAGGDTAPQIKIYTYDVELNGEGGIEFHRMESPSPDRPYTVEVQRFNEDEDELMGYRYAIDADDCDKLFKAAFHSRVMLEEM